MITKIKNHCDKHEEYYAVDHCQLGQASGGMTYCPDCQRALAEFWADRWGWEFNGIWRAKNEDEFMLRELDHKLVGAADRKLVDVVLTPAGALKAWEWARKQGYQIYIGDNLVLFETMDGGCTKEYSIGIYGPETAIILAASEVPIDTTETQLGGQE